MESVRYRSTQSLCVAVLWVVTATMTAACGSGDSTVPPATKSAQEAAAPRGARAAPDACDRDAVFGSVEICLLPASDTRRGVPVTNDCFWLNKAIGQKGLRGINAASAPAVYDVYVYNYCDVEADVDLVMADPDIRCDGVDASGAIPMGPVPPGGQPVRGTCRTIPYAYDENVPHRQGSYELRARIGSATGTYDPEVILEKAGEPNPGVLPPRPRAPRPVP